MKSIVNSYFKLIFIQHLQQPATSNQQPATSNQQPATSNQQPATSNQEQTAKTSLNHQHNRTNPLLCARSDLQNINSSFEAMSTFIIELSVAATILLATLSYSIVARLCSEWSCVTLEGPR
jgi:hypothetical protein